MRIGIFGGSFNPPHLGHKRLAQSIIEAAQLDKMLIVPAGAPPHKSDSELTGAEDRKQMCALTFSEPCFELCDFELEKQGKSYTVETVRYLRELYKNDELFLVIGSDMLLSFHKWYCYEEILGNVTLCVASRLDSIPASELEKYALDVLRLDRRRGDIIIADLPALEVSSTQLRSMLSRGIITDGLLEGKVADYIKCELLYTYPHKELRGLLRERLKEKRYLHSVNVAESARMLAEKYGADEEKAYFAGLVHDIMKNADEQEQLQIMEKGGIILSRTERENKKLWHAMAGEAYLRCELGITDEDILNAVRYHTTGRAGMSLLEKVIYIADYISVERDYPDADVMRELSLNKGLDEAALYALRYSFSSLSKKGKLIHTDSVEYYNELIMEGRGI